MGHSRVIHFNKKDLALCSYALQVKKNRLTVVPEEVTCANCLNQLLKEGRLKK